MAEEPSVQSSAGSSDTRKGSLENDDEEEFEPETFLERLISAVALEDVENINQTQKNMLNKFEKTNEMLVNCNALGQIHFEKLSKDYRKHTAKLVEMHKDLDWIFHRIRFLKQKLKQKYPDISCDKNISSLEDEEEVKLETSVQNSSSQSTTDDHSKQDQIEEENSMVTDIKSHSSENTVT